MTYLYFKIQLLTIDEAALPGEQDEDEHLLETNDAHVPNEELFFIDKSSATVTKTQVDKYYPPLCIFRDHKNFSVWVNFLIPILKVDEQESEDEIVITDTMLDEELAAMDKESEQVGWFRMVFIIVTLLVVLHKFNFKIGLHMSFIFKDVRFIYCRML